MSTEQFRALGAVCLMAITVCCVVAALQLNGIKVAEQRQACGAQVHSSGMDAGYGYQSSSHAAPSVWEHLNCEQLLTGEGN